MPHSPTKTGWTNARAPHLDPWREQDACGVGFIAQSDGRRSNAILAHALQALERVAHRGAASTDNSGDGAGVLTQIPQRFLYEECRAAGMPLEPGQPFAVGMFFLPADARAAGIATEIIEDVLAEEGMPVIAWRTVPADTAVLGPTARETCPAIRQAIISAPGSARSVVWERALYLARRGMEQRLAAEGGAAAETFVCSLSCRTVVYKALLTGTQLAAFYADLRSPLYETAIALFHQRYSTNTRSNWALVQPFRFLGHNGEINTLWGNRNAMRAREPGLTSPVWGGAAKRLAPIIWPEGSDSTSLDNALELLVRSGRDAVHSLMMLIPEAYQGVTDMDPALRGFYEFHECLIEPWDGPAALSFSDGVLAGAALDRNGLRPCRYKITRDGLVVAGSEVGLVDLDPAGVVESGTLGPGELIVVDTRTRKVLHNAEAKREVARRQPYARWAARGVRHLRPAAGVSPDQPVRTDLLGLHLAFGWSHEDVRHTVEPMSGEGQDAIWSMGDDTPIPPLSRLPHGLYAYVRQRFAQVTNPPIDSLREGLVMSLRMHLGRHGSLLLDRASGPILVRNDHPVLLGNEMAALRSIAGVPTVKLSATWNLGDTDSLRAGLDRLCSDAARAVRDGARILIVSDTDAGEQHPPLPMLLAIGAVHQHLLTKGLRTQAGLVAEAGDAWDVHHFAALIGYGAEAIHPWLALGSVSALAGDQVAQAQSRFRSAAEKGLLKIISKMGISTLSSYCGAQIFEALGLGHEVIDRCLPGTVSTLGGIGFAEIAEDILARHRQAYPDSGTMPAGLPDFGRVRFRKQGEDHGWSPPAVRALQREGYAGLVREMDTRAPAGPRDLLSIRSGVPIPLTEVEPVEVIRRRFISTAMSLGALSPEAHRTLAIGMNRMGARSNCGEGGEDPETWVPPASGDRADNKIKQIASGRFGVTTEYVARAEELEIKIAQGSKPGEGGQLPAHKVTALIARLRHAVPGIPLISPPPHHDIYSIEDLAQLIHDLKQVNPRARVGVKLVAQAGVGRVAAGVAKAYADYVLISGHNGGTGASPLSSIKHAGQPWELGLAETQALLMENGLRHRIEVRTDGGLRTGRDVVIAALLGAESFGFGTAPLVAIGCAMARQCHLNSCPTGIATQRPELREKFKGTPEQVVAYFTAIAEDVRQILSGLGFRRMDEIVGRTDLLERVDRPETPRARLLDLSLLLAPPPEGSPRHRTAPRNDRPGIDSLDERILPDVLASVDAGRPFEGSYPVANHHLTVGARIAGALVGKRANVRLRFHGSAGQSFGAFASAGMRLDLEGEANDHVGKGLSGGEISIRPFRTSAYAGASHEHAILGNVALYGATSGHLFASGRAGHRFAVRNSGAVAVIEGAGNHCCEYMTGGLVLVLGRVGRNFGAGMSNGTAYVLDESEDFTLRCNTDMVSVRSIEADDETTIRALVHEHAERTGSPRARDILSDWERYRPMFRAVTAGRVAVAAPAPDTPVAAPAGQP